MESLRKADIDYIFAHPKEIKILFQYILSTAKTIAHLFFRRAKSKRALSYDLAKSWLILHGFTEQFLS